MDETLDQIDTIATNSEATISDTEETTEASAQAESEPDTDTETSGEATEDYTGESNTLEDSQNEEKSEPSDDSTTDFAVNTEQQNKADDKEIDKELKELRNSSGPDISFSSTSDASYSFGHQFLRYLLVLIVGSVVLGIVSAILYLTVLNVDSSVLHGYLTVAEDPDSEEAQIWFTSPAVQELTNSMKSTSSLISVISWIITIVEFIIFKTWVFNAKDSGHTVAEVLKYFLAKPLIEGIIIGILMAIMAFGLSGLGSVSLLVGSVFALALFPFDCYLDRAFVFKCDEL